MANNTKDLWFSPEVMADLDVTPETISAEEAINAWLPILEYVKKHPRFSGASLEGKI